MGWPWRRKSCRRQGRRGRGEEREGAALEAGRDGAGSREEAKGRRGRPGKRQSSDLLHNSARREERGKEVVYLARD